MQEKYAHLSLVLQTKIGKNIGWMNFLNLSCLIKKEPPNLKNKEKKINDPVSKQFITLFMDYL